MEENTQSPESDLKEDKKTPRWITRTYEQVKNKLETKFKKLSFSDIISFLALILGLVAIFRDCSQQKSIEIIQYTLNQNEYRPNIKIAKIEFEEVSLIVIDSTDKATKLVNFSTLDTSKVQEVHSNIDVGVKFYVTNIGNSRAKIYARFYTDMAVGNDYLKKQIQEHPEQIVLDTSSDNYYPFLEIDSGDTIVQKHHFKINEIKDNKFTLHLLFFYENEIEQVFDTYYWARYEFKTDYIDLIMQEGQIQGKSIVLKDWNKFIMFKDENCTSSIYDKKQSEKLRKNMNLLSK